MIEKEGESSILIYGGIRWNNEKITRLYFMSDEYYPTYVLPLASVLVFKDRNGFFYFAEYEKLKNNQSYREIILDEKNKIDGIGQIKSNVDWVVSASFITPDIFYAVNNGILYKVKFNLNSCFCEQLLIFDNTIMAMGFFGLNMLYFNIYNEAYTIKLDNILNCQNEKPTRKMILFKNQAEIKLKQLSCGMSHAVLLDECGSIFTIGDNSRGQLGIGMENKYYDEFIHVETLGWSHVVKIASGGWHNLALNDNGDVYAWGWNKYGQLGLNTSLISEFPEIISNNVYGLCFERIVDITCGSSHSAALSYDGTVYVWGCNRFHQISTNSDKIAHVPVCFHSNTSKFDSINCGHYTTIAYINTKDYSI